MAIKGKGRTKRRGVGSAPKPVYVKPKRPILARKGFWIIVGSVALAAILISVVSAILVHNGNKHKAAQRAAEAAIVRNFGTQIDNALAPVGQGSSLTSFQVLPNLSTTISDFENGKLSAKAAAKQADDDGSKAKAALAAVQKVKGSSMIAGHTSDLNNLVIGQSQIESGLQLYQQVTDSLKLSTEASGSLQKRLLAHTSALLLTANQVFQGGYEALVGQRARFGLVSLSAQAPPGASGTVPGNVPPTP